MSQTPCFLEHLIKQSYRDGHLPTEAAEPCAIVAVVFLFFQAAHVGVGISGVEGLQAASASDYAIAQVTHF